VRLRENVPLPDLAGLSNLESLDLGRTKASAAGIAELEKALPNCKVVWDAEN